MADAKITSTNNLTETMKSMDDGTFARVVAAVSYNSDGTSVGDKKRYDLLTDQSSTGNGPRLGPITGGDYLWRVIASNWNGSTATLQFLDIDGLTWRDVTDDSEAPVALTENGSIVIGIAQGAALRVSVTNANPTRMYSVVAGI